MRLSRPLVTFALVLVLSSVPLEAQRRARCEQRDHTEYTAKIKEYTTEPFFLTEIVDHLPWNSCVPSPEVHLGRVVGAPDQLTYSSDIHAYMRLLAEKSPRVRVVDIGQSEEGRTMILVLISDEQNIANLERYRAITRRLADPRGLSEAEARALITEGKPFYWAATGIHSPETNGPEMFMELAYRLAVSEAPMIRQIRRDSIIMLTPVVETDGRDRMVDLYRYRKANPEKSPIPLVWWGHYVAHDNNRDGMTLSLALMRNMMAAFFQYHPQVFHDLHESIPYLYISTGTGPYNAWLDPITINEWQTMAHHEVKEMTKRGVIGVWTHGFYDGWAPNYMFYIANGHNSIGRFYETFGGAPAADTRVRMLGPAYTNREWYRPNPPLPKVKWSLRNHVNLAQSALLIGMHNVAANKQTFLENFYLKSRRAVAKGRTEGPAAWVFPADDSRPAEQARLLNLLKLQGLEVHRATEEIRLPASAPAAKAEENDAQAKPATEDKPAEQAQQAEKKDKAPKDTVFPAGSYVVRMDQPYSRMADMMLDTQYYSPRDPRSYDDTGWTIGALRNVKTARVMETAILDAAMEKVEGEVRAPGGVAGNGSSYVINHNTDNTLATLRFRYAQTPMEAAQEAFELDGRTFRAGSFILRDVDRAKLDADAKELGLQVHATSSAIEVPRHALAVPRIALMHTWQRTQDDGWYRIAMDVLQVPYTYIADTAVREMSDLRSRFDVVILPPLRGQDLNSMLRGIRRPGEPMPWRNTPEMPNLHRPGLSESDDIRGGLGYSGLANLQRFVSEGGLLIAVGSMTTVPVHGGMTEMVTVSEPANMQAPGGVLLTHIEDKKSPIAYGYEDKLHVYFRQGPVLGVGASTGLGFGQQDQTAQRSSGRGSLTDPDVIQGRPYMKPEPAERRSPRERETYIPEEMRETLRAMLPPRSEWPRVIARFAPEKELLHSGMLVGANQVAERPAVVHVPSGKGNIVLFANNPMWRDQTMGSFFLLFNAMLNFDQLQRGAAREEEAETAD